ncbi:MAG: S-methyl-5'-thioadenosine phosphorylase [Deltaproteobacteria bacterium]|nr:MAG: S-methyl-5'-thioadenosine phosphorylase [Deltaproteobacteria bacterium]
MTEPILGVLGGSGLYEMKGLAEREQVELDTPFGAPSGPYLLGRLAGRKVAFLARHGIGHRLMPTEINYRANIHGFRQLGVRHIVSVSAVGSLQQDIHPGDIVLPDQFIDRTRSRPSTFFGGGAVVHVQFGSPVCPAMSRALAEAIEKLGLRLHRGGTYVAMEGPAFSTRAESELYRSWGAHVIGMTALPEAKLAREAEICYVTMALCTDYDCWHESEEEVSVEAVLKVLKQNVANSEKVLEAFAKVFPPDGNCSCQQALENTLITDPKVIPPETRRRLRLLLGRFLER